MGFTLVLGGARSGKSRYAQSMAEAAAKASSTRPIAIVTAQVYDEEMAQRVALHQHDRSDAWATLEAPIDLCAAINSLKSTDIAVIDCMTLWLTNILLAEQDLASEIDQLLVALKASPAMIWIVSNEVGWGIVPDNALARRFRDEAGRLNQKLAEASEQAVLIVAGMKLDLARV